MKWRFNSASAIGATVFGCGFLAQGVLLADYASRYSEAYGTVCHCEIRFSTEYIGECGAVWTRSIAETFTSN